MKKVIILSIFCSIVFTKQIHSQQESFMSIQYAMGLGTGDMGDFISETSFRGAVIEYRSAVSSNLLVGIDLGWNVFYEKKNYDTYSIGTESLSGVQYRYQNAVPILISTDYLFLSASQFKPFASFGIGTIYYERATDMNIYRWKETTWQFALKPEIGFLYELSYSTSFKMAAKYYHGFKTTDLDAQGYFSLSAGFAFILN